MRLLAGPVGECFERTEEGHLINRRLEGERARACSIIENRRQAGRARHKPSTNSAPAKQAQSKGTGKRRNAEHEARGGGAGLGADQRGHA